MPGLEPGGIREIGKRSADPIAGSAPFNNVKTIDFLRTSTQGAGRSRQTDLSVRRSDTYHFVGISADANGCALETTEPNAWRRPQPRQICLNSSDHNKVVAVTRRH